MFAVVLLWLSLLTRAADTISSAEARQHIGQSATVCGNVTNIFFGETTAFVSLDEVPQESRFRVLIPEASGLSFGEVAKVYPNQNVCVTGKIEVNSGVPQVALTDVAQIKIQRKQK
jgi:hypothetical protein